MENLLQWMFKEYHIIIINILTAIGWHPVAVVQYTFTENIT